MSVLSSAPPPADGDLSVGISNSAPAPAAPSRPGGAPPLEPAGAAAGHADAAASSRPGPRALIRAALGTASGLASAALTSILLFALLAIGALRLASPSTGSAGLAAVVMVQLVLVAAAVVAGAKNHRPRSRDLDEAREAEADAEAEVQEIARSIAEVNAFVGGAQVRIATDVHCAVHVVTAIPAHCDAAIRGFYEGYMANSEPSEGDLYRGYGVGATPVLDDPVAFVMASLPPDVLDLPRVDPGDFLAEWARIEREYSPVPPAGGTGPTAGPAPAATPASAEGPGDHDEARARWQQQWARATARTRPAQARPSAAPGPDGAA